MTHGLGDAPPARAAHDRTDLLVVAATVAATAIAAACILLPTRLPFQDLMARAAFSDAVGAAIAGTDPLLSANLWPVHGWLYELVAWPLGLLLGPIGAERLLLAVSVAAIPAALARLLGAVGLPRAGTALCAPFLLSVPVVMAYVPFMASMPLCLLTLASLSGRPSWRTAALFLATYGLHAFGFVVAALCGAVGALVSRGWRASVRVALLSAPAAALTVVTSLTGEAARGLSWREGTLTRLGLALGRVVDVMASSVDTDLATVAVLTSLGAAALSVGRRASTAWRGPALGTAAVLGLALALPEHVASPPIFQLAERFLLPVALLLPVGLGVSLDGWRRRLLLIPPIGAVLVGSLLLASLLSWGAHPAPVERLLARVPAGAVLLNAVSYASDPRSPVARTLVANDAFRFRAERRGLVIGQYGHPHLPVRWRDPIASAAGSPPARFIEENAHLAGWVLTDAPPGHIPERGAGWSLEPVAEDGGLRLLRVARDAPTEPQ